MNNLHWVIQDPEPGTRTLMFQGDTLSFSLTLSHPQRGSAWLRTNIGHAKITREEIIKEVKDNIPPLGRDWFDVSMERIDDLTFLVTLPLCEVGHFESKCFFLKEDESNPVWPEGDNVVINVEPADTCCSNIIYNAFVRQFGPNKEKKRLNKREKNLIKALDNNGYTVIPPSGTFRDLIKELDFIIGELGCRIIQLLPIHPTPTTYARMGRFGSPYAALSFTGIDPALAEFDPGATPLEQFVELVDSIHERHAKIIIDIAINHTGWAANLHETHPQWLVRNSEGQIEVPGAWGVIWADLTALDYSDKSLWHYITDVFLTWCRRGVDGFRCDAGYMIPIPAWKYIVATVRQQYPDTIFLLEGLGGKISVTRDILNKANFNWTYSELFQNNDRLQIESYLPEANEISKSDGKTIHFAETHDNNRLSARSKIFASMRTALCALSSHQGGFGFANGVEWYATEKIDVHGAPSLNWGAETNQIKHISRLNTLLKIHPSFHDRTELQMVQKGKGNHIVILRHHIPSGKKLLIVANLDDERETLGVWDSLQTGMEGSALLDLISEEKVIITESKGQNSCPLGPGQVYCLTTDWNDIDLFKKSDSYNLLLPERIKKQRFFAKALQVMQFYNGVQDMGKFEPEQAARHLEEDPVGYCCSLNPFTNEPRVIKWQWPKDIKREVMVPPDHFLMVCADTPFHARIMDKNFCLQNEESLPCIDGSFFALFSPISPTTVHRSYTLKLSVYSLGKTQHAQGPLIFLSRGEDLMVKTTYDRMDISGQSIIMLGTNGRGGMFRANVSWGELTSRYDALLAANINPEIPEDRWIMFTRCRAWLVFQGYSQEISNDCFDSFYFNHNSAGFWRYKVPTGKGEHVILTICVKMIPGENTLHIRFARDSSKDRYQNLADHMHVQLILRPDIESRNFHETTKAYKGPEHFWPESVKPEPKGFTFTPETDRSLNLRISEGSFVWEPEWQYMIHRPVENERGLDPDSDLFSPGYFSSYLKGGQALDLVSRINITPDKESLNDTALIHDTEHCNYKNNKMYKFNEALKIALNHYVVKREPLNTVIAGYPWFLDWGRDAMIFVRGLIAAGKTENARTILIQFGQFEKDGTIPNMIRGKDAGDRDTSDAPLWFFIACDDLIRSEGNEDFLDTTCGNRTIRQILFSIANAYMAGTPNGIQMDPESGLIFSPAHFTWMDTNYPAGTPREGYPIEIQALWYAALSFLARIDPSENNRDWKQNAQHVKSSIFDLFLMEKEGYLYDCLHANSKEPARKAEPNDALRPNQLFAVTLGAVSEKAVCRNILAACEELLVPGAIRSLADRPVRRPLEIKHKGKTINNPHHPYMGKYFGDEDTKRKPAYHNGTAWTWIFPSFCEAWVKVYGKNAKNTALSFLAGSVRLFNEGCAGHLPEIVDGDYPHKQRGCDAQAWGASEFVRVWERLTSEN